MKATLKNHLLASIITQDKRKGHKKMTTRTFYGTMYTRFGIDIERVNLDPHNDLDLVDDDRADMALAAAELYADHAEDILDAACPEAEFTVSPNGEIHYRLGTDLARLEDNWDLVSEQIATGPDVDDIDDLLEHYAEINYDED